MTRSRSMGLPGRSVGHWLLCLALGCAGTLGSSADVSGQSLRPANPAPPTSLPPNSRLGSTNGGSDSASGTPQVADGKPLANPVQPANFTAAGEPFEPGKVLAIVAGQPVLAADQLLTINEIIETQAAGAPPFVRQRMLEQGMRELLPRTIERKMMYQEALLQLPGTANLEDIKKDLYKQVDEKQLPQILKKYQANNLSELDARLRSLGSSWRALREQVIEQEIAKYAVVSQLEVDTEVSYDQLLDRYRQNRDQYRVDNQARWEHLMVSFAKTPDREQAKRKLVGMGNEVVYGAPFGEVAKRSSDDFFAAQGGYNDWTRRGSLTNRTLEERIFSEPVGRLSDIIESELGFHIIRVIERQEAGLIPFTELQEKIRAEILEERQQVALQKLLDRIKRRIPYEIFLEGVEF